MTPDSIAGRGLARSLDCRPCCCGDRLERYEDAFHVAERDGGIDRARSSRARAAAAGAALYAVVVKIVSVDPSAPAVAWPTTL